MKPLCINFILKLMAQINIYTIYIYVSFKEAVHSNGPSEFNTILKECKI